MTVWPGFWQFRTLIPWMILVGIFIAGGASELAVDHVTAAAVAFTGPVVIVLFCWVMDGFRPRPIRLEVTESVVRARQGRWRWQPDMEAPRSEIRAIHYFPNLISFRGLDNNPIMMIQPQYTLRQMVKVAAELDVRLYDHSRWLGFRKVQIGRLAYDPASSPGAKTGK